MKNKQFEYKKGQMILYRGEKYKIKSVEMKQFGNNKFEFLQLPNKVYDIWVNAMYVQPL